MKTAAEITVQDSGEGIVLKVVPRFEDLIGIDAGKKDPKKL